MLRFAAALAAALAFGSAQAVYLSPDGQGQALIFPWYTINSSGNNPYNTYVTIVNHTADAKVLRVRFREGRNSREVASFNLFLSPRDAWAGALIMESGGAYPRVISADTSCTSPTFMPNVENPPGITFTNNFYTGSFADGNGSDPERAREGFVEVIEMATLLRASAQAITHVNGVPPNCAIVQGNYAADTGPPSGGISGTLTVINVANGMDFSVNAEALADLSAIAFYRPADDGYPSFNSAEVLPVSIVTANGFVFRSNWGRGVDAVSAVLMRSAMSGELILDTPTNSRTEFAVAFPTRQYYFAGGNDPAPFDPTCVNTGTGGQPMQLSIFDRDERGGLRPQGSFSCWAALSFEFGVTGHVPATPTLLLGARNTATASTILTPNDAQSGWARIAFPGNRTLFSLPGSTATHIISGQVTTSTHRHFGLPVVGFQLSSFENGTLTCGAGKCQGNYGGSFPLKFERTITAP